MATATATSTLDQATARSWFSRWVGPLPFIAVHVACLAVFYVDFHLRDLLLCAAIYFVRMFGITGGYHRYFAHRAYRTSRPVQFLLAMLGCSAMQKGPIWWAGHHRHHHRYSDTPEDVHSPVANSLWWSHLGWILSPDYDKANFRVMRDFRRYPELYWLDRHHWVPGVALAVGCFLFGFAFDGWPGGWSSLVWGFFVSTTLLYHAVFAVNSLCHIFGRRRYETTDQSRNNLPVALLTLGEGWHNNHHYYQSSANQGFFWWELDISYYIIRLLGLLGLVWDIRTPPAKLLHPRPVVENSRDLTAV
jgi:stearoyl-CoA desaturase (delta-9 desaturase)